MKLEITKTTFDQDSMTLRFEGVFTTSKATEMANQWLIDNVIDDRYTVELVDRDHDRCDFDVVEI